MPVTTRRVGYRGSPLASSGGLLIMYNVDQGSYLSVRWASGKIGSEHQSEMGQIFDARAQTRQRYYASLRGA